MVETLFVLRVILMIISLTIIGLIIFARKKQRLGHSFFIILVFWSSIFIVSFDPRILDSILNAIGLDNRAQFLLILSLVFIIYLLLQQTTKTKNISFNLFNIVRDIAISNFRKELFGSNSSIAIVIIAKNESNTIGNVIDKIKSLEIPTSYKIIVVNDGSTDDTEQIARQRGAFVVNHVHNLGIGAATKTGYIAAALLKSEIIINIDADGQHDPSYIPKMISILKNREADLVYGSRFSQESDYKTTIARSIGNKFYTSLVNRLGKISITDVNTGFRGIRADKLESIYFISENNFAIELALRGGRNGLKIAEIATTSNQRTSGQSQFQNLERFIIYNINAIKQIVNAFFKKPSEKLLFELVDK
jgi:hypothetical protein